jgi:hypothetical protein
LVSVQVIRTERALKLAHRTASLIYYGYKIISICVSWRVMVVSMP